MSWIDTLVVTIIVLGGLFIFYRALKEPVDLFFGFIKQGLVYLKDQMISMKDNVQEREVITYGQ